MYKNMHRGRGHPPQGGPRRPVADINALGNHGNSQHSTYHPGPSLYSRPPGGPVNYRPPTDNPQTSTSYMQHETHAPYPSQPPRPFMSRTEPSGVPPPAAEDTEYLQYRASMGQMREQPASVLQARDQVTAGLQATLTQEEQDLFCEFCNVHLKIQQYETHSKSISHIYKKKMSEASLSQGPAQQPMLVVQALEINKKLTKDKEQLSLIIDQKNKEMDALLGQWDQMSKMTEEVTQDKELALKKLIEVESQKKTLQKEKEQLRKVNTDLEEKVIKLEKTLTQKNSALAAASRQKILTRVHDSIKVIKRSLSPPARRRSPTPLVKRPVGKSPLGKDPLGKSPLGKSPLGNLACDLCNRSFMNETVLRHHYANLDHSMRYLSEMIKKGYSWYMDYLKNIPWEFVGKEIVYEKSKNTYMKMIQDVLRKDKSIYPMMLYRSGILNQYYCQICEKKLVCPSWMDHVKGKYHVEACGKFGMDDLIKKFWPIPGPHWKFIEENPSVSLGAPDYLIKRLEDEEAESITLENEAQEVLTASQLKRAHPDAISGPPSKTLASVSPDHKGQHHELPQGYNNMAAMLQDIDHRSPDVDHRRPDTDHRLRDQLPYPQHHGQNLLDSLDGEGIKKALRMLAASREEYLDQLKYQMRGSVDRLLVSLPVYEKEQFLEIRDKTGIDEPFQVVATMRMVNKLDPAVFKSLGDLLPSSEAFRLLLSGQF